MLSKKRKASELPLDGLEVASKSHLEMKYYNNVTQQQTWKSPTKKIHENRVLNKEPQSEPHVGSSRKRRLDISTYESGRTEKPRSQVPDKGQSTSKKAEISTSKEVINQVTKTKKKKKNKKKHKDNLLPVFNTPTEIKGSINVKLQSTAAPSSITTQGKKNYLDNSKTCQKLITVSEDDDNKHMSKIKNDNLGASGLAQDRPPVNFQLKKKEKQLAIFQNMFRFSKLKRKKSPGVDNAGKKKQDNADDSKKKKNSEAGDGSTESTTSSDCPIEIKDRIIQHIKADKNFQQKIRHLLMQSRDDVNKELLNNDTCMIVDEEMDWEPSKQEVMIEHIKSMRKNLDATDDICSKFIAFSKDSQKYVENNNLILVFDTNVFISCLPFIKGIVDTSIPGLGLPTLYIPWRVLHELDKLKSSTNKQLQLSARKAMRYINDTFSSRHRRVTGQSFEEYMSMKTGEKLLPDDEILKTCLDLRMADSCRSVILITNDKNLESKAITSKLEAYSKDRFMTEKLDVNVINSVGGVNMTSKKPNPVDSALFVQLKYLLKNLLEEILKTELIKAFGKDWTKIVSRKPPWTLIDVLECYIKHWRSVFTFVFKKDVLTSVENIKKYFLTAEEKNASATEVIENSKDLLFAMRDNIIPKETSYDKKLTETITEVESLNETGVKTDLIIPVNNFVKLTQDASREKSFNEISSQMCIPLSSDRIQNIFMDSPMFDEQQCREKTKALFQAVWESVKNYCCRINELASSSGMNSNDIYQLNYQYPNAMRALQELIEYIEKILSSEPEEIERSCQLVQGFTNLLVNLNVFQIEASEMKDLHQYIGFFCCDNEGRAILRILINELRQFAWQIMNSVKALEFV